MYTNTTKSVKIYAVRVTQTYAIAFLKSVKYISVFHKHSNGKKFWEEKQTNLTIKLHYETTHEIIEKKIQTWFWKIPCLKQ